MAAVVTPAQKSPGGVCCRFVVCRVNSSSDLWSFHVRTLHEEHALGLSVAENSSYLTRLTMGEDEQKILLDTKGWFNNELVDMGVGMIWANLLTPCFPFLRCGFSTTKGRNILNCPPVNDSPKPGKGRGSGPALCYDSFVWQGTMALHMAMIADPQKKMAKGNSLTDDPVDPDIHCRSDLGPLPPPTRDERVQGKSESLRTQMRVGVARARSEMGVLPLPPSTLPRKLSSDTLYDFVRTHGADTLVFPANVRSNHWVSVAVTGLAGLVETMDLNTTRPHRVTWQKQNIAGGSQRKCRVILLDSFETASVSEARVQPMSLYASDESGQAALAAKTIVRKRKKDDSVGKSTKKSKASCERAHVNVGKSLKKVGGAKTSKRTKRNVPSTSGNELPWEKLSLPLQVLEVVLTLLANEWVYSYDPDNSSSAGGYVKALQEVRTILMRHVYVSFPEVPQQSDHSQCGPMAVLAMQVFCTDEEFRQYCMNNIAFPRHSSSVLGFAPVEGVPVPERRDDSLSTRPEAYSFEASFELRRKILNFVRKMRKNAAQTNR